MAETTNGPRSHTLLTPVTITRKAVGSDQEQEDTVHVLNFRKPKGADFRSLDNAKGEMGKLIAFAAQIADVPVLVIDKLDADDFQAVAEIAGGFLNKSPQTGAIS
jgi:hypothetical protein